MTNGDFSKDFLSFYSKWAAITTIKLNKIYRPVRLFWPNVLYTLLLTIIYFSCLYINENLGVLLEVISGASKSMNVSNISNSPCYTNLSCELNE